MAKRKKDKDSLSKLLETDITSGYSTFKAILANLHRQGLCFYNDDRIEVHNSIHKIAQNDRYAKYWKDFVFSNRGHWFYSDELDHAIWCLMMADMLVFFGDDDLAIMKSIEITWDKYLKPFYKKADLYRVAEMAQQFAKDVKARKDKEKPCDT